MSDMNQTYVPEFHVCNKTLGFGRCLDGACFELIKTCDGLLDCNDGYDEAGCKAYSILFMVDLLNKSGFSPTPKLVILTSKSFLRNEENVPSAKCCLPWDLINSLWFSVHCSATGLVLINLRLYKTLKKYVLLVLVK